MERPYAPETVDFYEEIDDVFDIIVLDHNYHGEDELNQFVSVVESGTDMLGVSANSRTSAFTFMSYLIPEGWALAASMYAYKADPKVVKTYNSNVVIPNLQGGFGMTIMFAVIKRHIIASSIYKATPRNTQTMDMSFIFLIAKKTLYFHYQILFDQETAPITIFKLVNCIHRG